MRISETLIAATVSAATEALAERKLRYIRNSLRFSVG
jgi:hypothetical protein